MIDTMLVTLVVCVIFGVLIGVFSGFWVCWRCLRVDPILGKNRLDDELPTEAGVADAEDEDEEEFDDLR